MSKLLVRAEVLAAIKSIKSSNLLSAEFLQKTVDKLKDIEDKDFLLEILVKEFIKETEEQSLLILKFFMTDLIDKDKLISKIWDILKNTAVKDEIKINAINFLKEIDDKIVYEDYMDCIKDPDALIDYDTQNLVNESSKSPSVRVDFCDFLKVLPENDKEMLLYSLADEFKGDNFANILEPVLFASGNKNIVEKILTFLGNSKSSLAVKILNDFIATIKDEELLHIAKSQLKILKISGAREEKAIDFYKKVNENSKIFECLVSFPDGHGNIAVIVARKLNGRTITFFSTVINLKYGVLDSFGFYNISKMEYTRILDKFLFSQKINVPPEFAKSLLSNAEKLNIKNSTFLPYEYIAWKILLADVDNIEFFEDCLTRNSQKVALSEQKLHNLYDSELIDTWFFDELENEKFANFINKVDDELAKGSPDLLEHVNALIEKNLFNIFDKEELQILNLKLLISAYLTNIIDTKAISDILYSLTEETEYKKIFLVEILRKSVYEYYLRKNEAFETEFQTTNIFLKKNAKELNKGDKIRYQYILSEIEGNWAK